MVHRCRAAWPHLLFIDLIGHASVRADCSCIAVVLKVLFATLAILGSAVVTTPAMAGNVMEEVAQTGVLVAGTSKDAFPFAFQNDQGELVGYSIDMMELIRSQLQKELNRPVRLQLVALNPEERIPKLESDEVNLVCDASSFTWDRDRKVDFSVSYAITGTQLLVPSGSTISSPESLRGQRIGALPRTTSERAIRARQPDAVVVLLQDRDSGYRALASGEIDAFADDGNLLYSWLARNPSSSSFKVAPDSYSKEGIACMLPENNSRFEGAVNKALVRYMQGFLANRSPYTDIFDRWFGPNSVVPATQELRNLYIDTMQLIVDFKEELPEQDL